MNCIWEIVLKAKKIGYKLEELRFINSMEGIDRNIIENYIAVKEGKLKGAHQVLYLGDLFKNY